VRATSSRSYLLHAPRLVEALRVFARSSRAVARAARARYATDLVKWPHRREFDVFWRKVDHIPGWFHEGSAAASASGGDRVGWGGIQHPHRLGRGNGTFGGVDESELAGK